MEGSPNVPYIHVVLVYDIQRDSSSQGRHKLTPTLYSKVLQKAGLSEERSTDDDWSCLATWWHSLTTDQDKGTGDMF